MSFESPLARAIRLASQYIGQGIQQAGQIRREEERFTEQQFRAQKTQNADLVTRALADPFISEERRRQLEAELREINSAGSIDELEAALAGREGTPAQPARELASTRQGAPSRGAAPRAATPGEAPTQSMVAGASAESQRAERAYNATQQQYNTILQAVNAREMDPAERQRVARDFLGGINPEHLEPGQENTLMALSGYTDQNAFRQAVAGTEIAEARATTAGVEAEVAVATQQAAIDTAVANARRATTEADVGARTADARVARERLALTADRQSLVQSAEQHAQRMTLTDLQEEELRQSIDQSATRFEREGQLFERQLTAADFKAVQGALDTGVTTFLTESQRNATMLAQGLNPDNPDDVKAFESQMQTRYNNYQEAVTSGLKADALADEVAGTQLESTRENLRRARLEFDRASYDFERAKRIDPIEDAARFQSTLTEAVWAGDTVTLEHWLTVLENPDRFGSQAGALEDMGLSSDKIRGMLDIARSERALIRENDEVRIATSREQLRNLENTNNEYEAMGLLANVAENYVSVEQFNGDLDRLTERFNLKPDETEYIRRSIRFRENVLSRDQAKERLNSFVQVAPPSGSFQAWSNQFVDTAMQAGLEEREALLLAEGWLQAFQREDQDRARQIQQDVLRSRLLQAQIRNAEAPPPSAGPGEDPNAQTRSDLRLELNATLNAIESEQEAVGCVQVMNVGGVPVRVPQELRGESAPKCDALANDVSLISSELAALAGANTSSRRERENAPAPAPTAAPEGDFTTGDTTIPSTYVDRVRGWGNLGESGKRSLLAELESNYGQEATQALIDAVLGQ